MSVAPVQLAEMPFELSPSSKIQAPTHKRINASQDRLLHGILLNYYELIDANIISHPAPGNRAEDSHNSSLQLAQLLRLSRIRLVANVSSLIFQLCSHFPDKEPLRSRLTPRSVTCYHFSLSASQHIVQTSRSRSNDERARSSILIPFSRARKSSGDIRPGACRRLLCFAEG
jgi:hypothetical protein